MTTLKRAQAVARKYGTNDPYQILTQLGVTVIPCRLSGVRGIYKQLKRNTFVFVDSGLDERTRDFVLGHELAHHLLHRGNNRMFLEHCTYFRTSRFEKEADLFSLCLMAPDPAEVIHRGETTDHLAARMGVTYQQAEAYRQEVLPQVLAIHWTRHQ